MNNKFSELFKMADGLMLTGSYASNKFVENSDIDIIVLSKNINYVFSETVGFDLKYVQLIFFPYNKFQDIIIDDKNRGKGVYASMIRNGIIFKDTPSKILTKTKKNLLNTRDEHRCEQLDYALIHKITSNIDVMKGSTSLAENIYCGAELLLDITRLITGKYVSDAKHLARLITAGNFDVDILDSFLQFVLTNNSSVFIKDTEVIMSKYGGPQYEWTSAWVFNYPHNKHIMVFFPSQVGHNIKFQKYRDGFQAIFHECHVYGFYIGKNQSLEEGYYVYIYTNKVPIDIVLRKLENYKNSIINDTLEPNIQISFPYKSLFHQGLQFGGKQLFNRILPCFTQIWRSYINLLSVTSGVNSENYSRILATYYFSKLNDESDILPCEFLDLLRTFYDVLFLEAVDPNGLYNVSQMCVMKEKTFKTYLQSYHKNSVAYHKVITSIKDDSQIELNDLKQAFLVLFDLFQNISEEEILYPDIYPTKNKKETLMLNISFHIMSIFQLSPQEKFGVIFNFLQYKTNDI